MPVNYNVRLGERVRILRGQSKGRTGIVVGIRRDRDSAIVQYGPTSYHRAQTQLRNLEKLSAGVTHETHKPTVAVDVDGVLADFSKGWQGADKIGNPLPGAKEFLLRLHNAGWKVVIFTTRGKEFIEEYCRKHNLYYDEINDNSSLRGENPGKVIANVYLDDRGLKFNGNFDEAFEQITNFKVWYEHD